MAFHINTQTHTAVRACDVTECLAIIICVVACVSVFICILLYNVHSYSVKMLFVYVLKGKKICVSHLKDRTHINISSRVIWMVLTSKDSIQEQEWAWEWESKIRIKNICISNNCVTSVSFSDDDYYHIFFFFFIFISQVKWNTKKNWQQRVRAPLCVWIRVAKKKGDEIKCYCHLINMKWNKKWLNEYEQSNETQ